MLRTGDSVELEGSIDTVTYSNADNGFTVIRVKVDEQYASLAVVHPQRRICVCCGQLAGLGVGTRISLKGNVGNHSVHGMQVNVTSFSVTQPKSERDVVRFMQNEVKLIGPTLARAIYRHFGDNSLDILDNHPDRLSEVRGIGLARIEKVKEAWAEKKEKRELMFFCSSAGLSATFTDRIFKKYGKNAQFQIRQNPYILCRDIVGIGFNTADEVAKNLGMQEVDPKRIEALAEHILSEGGSSNGHCFMYVQEVIPKMGMFFKQSMVDLNAINTAIDHAVAQGIIVREENRLYLPLMARHENYVASRLSEILNYPKDGLNGAVLNDVFYAVEREFDVQMSAEQRQGVYAALACKVFALTGNPGVGKTTVTKAIVSGYQKLNIPVTLMAPTGKAARRMEELIGVRATTVHRRLAELDGYVRSHEEIDIEEVQMRGVIIMDEWSMADISLMAWLLKYVHVSASLVFVGDKDQLPSVGPGSVLKDLMESRVIPSIHLTQIFRQAEASNIITNAHRINKGHMPVLAPMQEESFFRRFDMVTYAASGEQSIQQAVLYTVTQLIPALGLNPVSDCIVLAPTHRGFAGVQNFNSMLQRVLNPNPTDWVPRGNGVVWAIGDRVMQFKNNYRLGVFNGDQGTIIGIEKKNEGNDIQYLTVQFDDGPVEYRDGTWMELQLCYASTIHKVQGCEYPAVIIVIDRSHGLLLERNLLYTAVTRGRQKVFLIYEPDALSRCVSRASADKRNTFLAIKLYQANPVDA